jgi:hypothetical protein
VFELSCIVRGPVGIRVACLNLLEELEAPRPVEPCPLDRFEERFGVDPRALRELLPRSSIVLVVDHEEEVGGREEETKYKEIRRKSDCESSYCDCSLFTIVADAHNLDNAGIRPKPILANSAKAAFSLGTKMSEQVPMDGGVESYLYILTFCDVGGMRNLKPRKASA